MVAPNVKALAPVPEVSESDLDRVRRAVASQATDADDARELLQMLGLLGPEFAECPGRETWYRKGCRCANCKRVWAERRARERARKEAA